VSKIRKNLIFIYLALLLATINSCSSLSRYKFHLKLRIPSSINQEKGNHISLARRERILSLTNSYLLNPSGRKLVEKILPYEIHNHESINEASQSISKKDKLPIEGNFIFLIEKFSELETFLFKHLEKTTGLLSDDSIKEFKEDFEKIEKVREIIRVNLSLSATRPHLVRDEKGEKTTRYKQVFSNHSSVMDDGRVIGATDILEAKLKFIKELEGDIWANVFDFDLLELADAFVEKVKEGKKVIVGIDKSNYDNKVSVRKVVDRLRKGGVKVQLVQSDGLSHQKIIAGGIGLKGKGKVIFSSGNFTSSGIHKDGDLGELGLSHELSFPNANNFLEVHDDHVALIVRHELEKSLVYNQKRNDYPMANFYRFLGSHVDSYGDTSIDLAFTPNGGLGNIMSHILAPEIEMRSGDVFVATFAYPNGPINDALFKRATKEITENGRFNFIGIGDTSFSTRPWSSFVEMIAHSEEKTPHIEESILVPDFENRWLRLLGRERMREQVRSIYSAPFVYGRHEVNIGEKTFDFAAKLHHKMMVIDHNTAIVGNSANFSNAAVEKNHEQFVIVHDPQIAERARGAVRGLVRDATPLIRTINHRRKTRLEVDKQANLLMKKILDFIDSSSHYVEEAQEDASRLESLIGYEKARKMLLRYNKKRQIPRANQEQLAFSFDLDDNILNLETKIK